MSEINLSDIENPNTINNNDNEKILDFHSELEIKNPLETEIEDKLDKLEIYNKKCKKKMDFL